MDSEGKDLNEGSAVAAAGTLDIPLRLILSFCFILITTACIMTGTAIHNACLLRLRRHPIKGYHEPVEPKEAHTYNHYVCKKFHILCKNSKSSVLKCAF